MTLTHAFFLCMHTFDDMLFLFNILSVCIGPLFFSKKKNLFIKQWIAPCARSDGGGVSGRQPRRDDEMANFFITSFSGVGAYALQMTYAYKKSEHHHVAHSLFGNFEMDNSLNNELRKSVLRLAARARHGRNPDWLRRYRCMSRENLITQLRLVLRQTSGIVQELGFIMHSHIRAKFKLS